MNWIDELKNQIDAKIQEAGNHVVIVPALGDNAPVDTVDVYDGGAKAFIATHVPEKTATDFAILYNGLVDSGYQPENIRKIDLAWLSGVNSDRRVYA